MSTIFVPSLHHNHLQTIKTKQFMQDVISYQKARKKYQYLLEIADEVEENSGFDARAELIILFRKAYYWFDYFYTIVPSKYSHQGWDEYVNRIPKRN